MTISRLRVVFAIIFISMITFFLFVSGQIRPAYAQETSAPVLPAATQPYQPALPPDTTQLPGLTDAASSSGSMIANPAAGDQTALNADDPLNLPEAELVAEEPESGSKGVFDLVRSVVPQGMHNATFALQGATDTSTTFLVDGGPSIWAIALLSVITVALILWKIWRLALIGAWSKGKARIAVLKWEGGAHAPALSGVEKRRGLRSKVVAAAMQGCLQKPEATAREETTRVARHELAEASTGLRALELIATIAPLLGLLGTVLGMIAAFQALQESGNRADPALLAGGIWEALLTTAAGMAVAIPASAALTWFESVIDRMRRDVEDATTRVFVAYDGHERDVLKLVAE